jgi:hypothetical protein
MQITINGILYGNVPLLVTKSAHKAFEISGKGWKRMYLSEKQIGNQYSGYYPSKVGNKHGRYGVTCFFNIYNTKV